MRPVETTFEDRLPARTGHTASTGLPWPVRAVTVCSCLLLAASCGPEPDSAPLENASEQTAAVDSVPFADLHLHLASQGTADVLNSVRELLEPDGQPFSAAYAADVLPALDAAGIERGLVVSNAYMLGMPEVQVDGEAERVREENRFVAQQAGQHPGRLTAACSVNPLKDYAGREVAFCLDSLGVGVLKLHLANSDVDLLDPGEQARLREIVGLVADRDGALFVHLRTRAEDFGAAHAQAFIDEVLVPNRGLRVHVAHMAGWGGYDEGTDAALGAFAEGLEAGQVDPDRTWFGLGAVVFDPRVAGADTAAAEQVRTWNRRLVERIRQIGPERVAYATDWPSWPPIPDPSARVSANVRMIREVLDLTPAEWGAVYRTTSILPTP